MSWLFVVIAGLFEMLGVVFINTFNQNKTIKNGLLMFAGFGLSFVFLTLAMNGLPMGTAYAVWTGIGAAGGTILSMIFYHEAKDWKRVLCIGLILSSTVGLKLIGE
ncbi:MAG: multidrug efflux SMR transporter [Exiguobacterium oxidotolerans]|uniref:Guanidinium efflux transporter subunit n=1 Tax=Exiguobacterium oxidotolerans TaxID=223958 RepID=A0A653I4Q9_9BACL|nr:multidrug efflux SMR transporter [Exiguobacterium oxidotolerans]VWX33736.1 guanidinium efflux transporter subunit [Exiguobacterium oxidotolerans]